MTPTTFLSRVLRPSSVAAGVMLALMYGLAFYGNAMAQSQITLTTNEIPGVELLGSEHIPENVSSAIKTNNLSGILPYTVVVHNTGSLPITGLDIRYELLIAGDLVVHNFFYGSPGDLADPESFPVIAPGKTAVIGPSHVVNEQLMSWTGLSPSSGLVSNVKATVERFYSRAERISVSIDSVIRSDGVLRGPDQSGTLQKFKQQMSGYTEFRDQLLKRFEAGASDVEVKLWLQQIADAILVSPGKNRPVDQSIVIKKDLAREYLAHITHGRRQRAWDTLKTASPELYLRRIAKVRKEAQR